MWNGVPSQPKPMVKTPGPSPPWAAANSATVEAAFGPGATGRPVPASYLVQR